jgi:hypothetical protein
MVHIWDRLQGEEQAASLPSLEHLTCMPKASESDWYPLLSPWTKLKQTHGLEQALYRKAQPLGMAEVIPS